jgi:hypothetical protein
MIAFSNPDSLIFTQIFPKRGYFGYFLARFLYVYSFTSGSAAAMLFSLSNDSNFNSLWAISSLGALMADLVLILFIQSFFENEIKLLSKESFMKRLNLIFFKIFKNFKNFFYYILGFMLIASPLPTEAGVFMVSSLKGFKLKNFLLLIAILHSIGIGNNILKIINSLNNYLKTRAGINY